MERDPADDLRHPRQLPDAPPDEELRALLAGVRTIAVIGASARDGRPANYVPAYMSRHGFEVVGVNPGIAGQTLFEAPVTATLAELERPVDLVNVFRRDADIPGHLDDILALDPPPKAVWIQLGLRNDEVAARLRAEGIAVIQDRCLMVEHRRLFGVVDG
jgi:predicted CoA-binding protein